MAGGSFSTKNLTITELPEGKQVVVCPWFDTNLTGKLDDGDLVTRNGWDLHVGAQVTLGTDLTAGTEQDPLNIGNVYYYLDHSLKAQSKKAFIAYTTYVNLIDLDTFTVDNPDGVAIDYSGQPITNITVAAPWGTDKYVIGTADTTPAVLLPVSKTGPAQLTGSVELTDADDVRDLLIYPYNSADHALVVGLYGTYGDLWWANLSSLAGGGTSQADYLDVYMTIGAVRDVAFDDNKIYVTSEGTSYPEQPEDLTDGQHYLWVFDLDSNGKPDVSGAHNGSAWNAGRKFEAGTPVVDGARCALETRSGGLFVGTIGTTKYALVGNGMDISVFSLASGTPARIDYDAGQGGDQDLQVHQWAQAIRTIRQGSDGAVFAQSWCVASEIWPVPITGGSGNQEIFRQSVIQLEERSGRVEIAEISGQLQEFDLAGRSLTEWAMARGSYIMGIPEPTQWAGIPYGNGQMVLTDDYLFVATSSTYQDQILVIDRRTRATIPLGHEKKWNLFVNKEAAGQYAMLPFGLWAVQSIGGTPYDYTSTTWYAVRIFDVFDK